MLGRKTSRQAEHVAGPKRGSSSAWNPQK